MKPDAADTYSDPRFEELLADVIREKPGAEPAADFAASVMAALPEQAPVVVPELEPESGIQAIAALAAAVGGLWYWGGSIVLWLYGVETERVIHMSEVSFDLLLFVEEMKSAIAGADLPLMTVAFLALLGVTAWGATSMASGSRVRA